MGWSSRHLWVVPALRPLTAMLVAIVFMASGIVSAEHDHRNGEAHQHAAGACILCGGVWDDDDEPDPVIGSAMAEVAGVLRSEGARAALSSAVTKISRMRPPSRGPPAHS